MKIRPFFIWASGLLLVISIAGLAYLGTYTRFHADDFCMAGDAIHLGLASMLVKWYTTWTGRFMFILGTGLFGLGGPKLAGWLPALAAVTWLIGIAWAVLPLIKRSDWPHPRWLAILAAGLALLVLLSSIPNLFQSFFWQDGMVNYSLPLIGLTYCIGIILRAWLEHTHTLSTCIVLFVLAFLCGGFTESFTAMEVALFTLALLISLILGDRPSRLRLSPILSAALLGGLAAMLVVVIAPGNLVRIQAVGGQASHPGLFRIITFSIRNMTHIFGKYFLKTPFWALASIIPPFLAGWLFSVPTTGFSRIWNLPALWKQNWFKGITLITLASLILVTAACAPVVYALNAYPDDRTIIVPQFAIVVSVISVSVLLGIGLRRQGVLPNPMENLSVSHALQVSILVTILFITGISFRHTISQIPEFQSYSKLWDERAVLIQQAALSGQTEVTVPGSYSRFTVADLATDPNNWVNRCMAYYYSIPQIRGR